jgi:ubiquinone/menaquinone biosynthesis C-methylase UbiE
MSKLDNELWLFDYDQGVAYEAFSQCEDAFESVNKHLSKIYDFQGKTILEVGAGSGKFTSFLAKSCSKLYVVERSASLMQINRNKNNVAKNVEFILSDVRDLVLEPNSVDVVFGGWSVTSMRDSFDVVFSVFKDVLKKDGIIILVENAGNDEFSRIVDIEDFSFNMEEIYNKMGFISKKVVDTTIKLPHKQVFYDAFPSKRGVKLSALGILHKVLILEMPATILKQIREV